MLSLWHAWLPRPQGPQTWWRTDGDKNNKHHKQCQQDFSTADHAQVLLITLLTPLGVLWAEGPFGQLLKITSIPSLPPTHRRHIHLWNGFQGFTKHFEPMGESQP